MPRDRRTAAGNNGRRVRDTPVRRSLRAGGAASPASPASPAMIGSWLRRVALRTIRQFELRLERFKLADRRIVREQLVDDPVVREAMAIHARERGLSADQAAD